MACTALTRGRVLDCNRISGGINAVYFAVLDQITSITYTAGVVSREITDIQMGSNKLYKYALPIGTSSLTETIVGSRENGTVYYQPTINIVYNKLSKEDQMEIKFLAATKTVVFAQLNQQLANGHDVIVALGTTNGMELNAGTIDSGQAWADRNGYSLTLDGMEQQPFPMMEDYTTDPFDAGITFGGIESTGL